jgi:hypothetical protein
MKHTFIDRTSLVANSKAELYVTFKHTGGWLLGDGNRRGGIGMETIQHCLIIKMQMYSSIQPVGLRYTAMSKLIGSLLHVITRLHAPIWHRTSIPCHMHMDTKPCCMWIQGQIHMKAYRAINCMHLNMRFLKVSMQQEFFCLEKITWTIIEKVLFYV